MRAIQSASTFQENVQHDLKHIIHSTTPSLLTKALS